MTDSRALAPPATALLAPQLDYILLDGSSSMRPKWMDTLAAIDAFVDGLRAVNLNSQVILSVFEDTDLALIQRNQRLRDWTPLCDEPIGSYFTGTPLYDAINYMGRHLRDLNPARASILIATDGEEMSSRHTDATTAKAILQWCRAKGWAVTMIGCDFNNAQEAKDLGLSEAQCIGVQRTKLSDAARAFATKRIHHYHSGEDPHFTGDEKSQFGGYLTKGPEAH